MTRQPMTRQIRSRLAGLKLPQHTLAAMLGVSQTKLNLILNGHRKPPAGFEAEAGRRSTGWSRSSWPRPRGGRTCCGVRRAVLPLSALEEAVENSL